MKTTATAPTISIADVLRALGKCAALCTLYALQRIAEGFGLAQRITLSACQWLNSRHNFTDKEDPVIMTGWQYLGFGVVVCAVFFALSIRID